MSSNDEAPPPSYAQATGSSAASSSHLHPGSAGGRSERNGIPISARRSMEDERRPLPKGWVRSFDPNHNHQFFVDTTKDPPVSIWHHPYDDDKYLSTLSSEERERIQAESMRMREEYDDSTDEEKSEKKTGGGSSGKARPAPQAGPASPMAGPSSAAGASQAGPSNSGGGSQSFGRKLKDRLTNSTHEEREQARRVRAQQEEQAYRLHLQFRDALSRAIQTGQPQFVCTGPRGRDIYVEPPHGARVPTGAHGVNPYSQGPYTNPNARFIRPEQVYGRRPGDAFGGGMGVPLAAGGIAGAAGGLLLGGLLF